MSTLQIGLAIAGGVVLAGVVAHSTWTSRKNKPRQAEPLPQDETALPKPATVAQEPSFDLPVEPAFEHAPASSPAASVAMDNLPLSHDPVSDLARSMMQEATLHAQRVPDEAELARIAADQARVAQEHAARSAQQAASTSGSNLTPMIDKVMDGVASPELLQPEKRPSLDALIDVMASIEIEHPISGEAVLTALPTTRRVGSKLFNLEGLNAETGLWEYPRGSQRYSAFQAGVQLANRMGPLNEIEFSEFVLKTQTFADAINGAPEFPDMLEEVARARELDGFAGGVAGEFHDVRKAEVQQGLDVGDARAGAVGRRGAGGWIVAGVEGFQVTGRDEVRAGAGADEEPVIGVVIAERAGEDALGGVDAAEGKRDMAHRGITGFPLFLGDVAFDGDGGGVVGIDGEVGVRIAAAEDAQAGRSKIGHVDKLVVEHEEELEPHLGAAREAGGVAGEVDEALVDLVAEFNLGAHARIAVVSVAHGDATPTLVGVWPLVNLPPVKV